MNKKSPRVVLDTNVLISALNFGGIPSRLVLLGSVGEVSLFTSCFILEETHGVLMRKFAWKRARADEAIQLLKEVMTVVVSLDRLFVVGDEPDNRVLECAVAACADYLVSGDQDLLCLECYEEIQIVTVRGFLDVVGDV